MPNELMPQVLVCLVALGMALAFLSADRQSPTSRALAIALAGAAMSIDLNIVVALQFSLPPEVTGWFGWTEAVAMIAVLEWVRGVRRTVPAGTLNTRFGDHALRFGQASAVAYGVLSVLYPEVRSTQFLGGLADVEAPSRGGFWIFATPVLIATVAALGSILLLLNRRPDRPERVRVLAMMAAIPFFIASMVVPLEHNALVMALGLILFFIGAVHYHVLQGQRGQFLSRFLSPQVAELVAQRGLARAMQENHLHITVVCCDLRGFTPYAEAQASAAVLRVLREYYDLVGAEVAEARGTIKDFAGDGVLILVGAPLPLDDHARRGIELARRIRAAVEARVPDWSTPTHRLGIGIGVASGPVTLGVIGSALRLEYTAVGPAVNLACRLCEQAAPGEVLVDARTAAAVHDAALELRPSVPVKGFAQPLPRYAIPTA